MKENAMPLWAFILIVGGLFIGGFLIGFDTGRSGAFNRIDDGQILMQECQEVWTSKIVQGAPVQVQEWYCKVGDW